MTKTLECKLFIYMKVRVLVVSHANVELLQKYKCAVMKLSTILLDWVLII